jgi:hypothetical protein
MNIIMVQKTLSSSRQATPPLILLGLKKYFSQTFQEIE